MIKKETMEHLHKMSLGINPMAKQEYPPAVYNVRKTFDSNKNSTYDLVLAEDVHNNRFSVPDTIYGDIMKYLKRIWNTFAIAKHSVGAMFIGNSGSGKTDATNILCNIGLNNNLYIVMIVNIDPDLGLIKFLNTLDNCIMVFEEFTKNFSWGMQEKMLTMFSNSSCKRLYLLNDNEKSNMSNFILDRPGRIKYKRQFSKLDEDVFKKYIVDHGIDPTSQFYSDMMDMYKTTTILSMDHVKHIISEHLMYPEDTLKEILNILNVGVLQKEVTYEVIEIKAKDKDEYYKLSRSGKILKDGFDTGRAFWVNIELITPAVAPEPSANPMSLNPMPIGSGMGGRGMNRSIHGVKLNNDVILDSNKFMTIAEVEHNGDKYIFKMMKNEE